MTSESLQRMVSVYGSIRQREVDKGLRLLCCSKPTSDRVLDLQQHDYRSPTTALT